MADNNTGYGAFYSRPEKIPEGVITGLDGTTTGTVEPISGGDGAVGPGKDGIYSTEVISTPSTGDTDSFFVSPGKPDSGKPDPISSLHPVDGDTSLVDGDGAVGPGKDGIYSVVSPGKPDPGKPDSISSLHPVTVISTSLGEVQPNANKLAIKVPSTVNKDTLRCDSRGDAFAEAMFRPGNGHYDRLKKSFDNIAKICTQALKNKKIDVSTVKSELRDVKIKATKQSKACESRRAELQKQYDLTSDIFNTTVR